MNKIDLLKAKRAEKIARYQAICGDFPIPEEGNCNDEEQEQESDQGSQFRLPEFELPPIPPFIPIPGRNPSHVF